MNTYDTCSLKSCPPSFDYVAQIIYKIYNIYLDDFCMRCDNMILIFLFGYNFSGVPAEEHRWNSGNGWTWEPGVNQMWPP